MLKQQKLHTQRYSDAIQLKPEQDNDESLCYYFSNGSIITWNIHKNQSKIYIEYAKSYLKSPLATPITDSCLYRYGAKTQIHPHDYFNVDLLQLGEQNPELKLALSHAFSLSIKLSQYETTIQKLINKHTPIIQNLAKKGRLKLSRQAIQQMIGEVLIAKSLINLKSAYTYKPTFFWQYANLEADYSILEHYLDLPQRTNALNQRLETLNEIFSILHSQLENRHSHFLEVIIIILIVLEIVFGILHLQLVL